MAFFNYSTMQMTAKIVYYGPGLCGKTTNLQYIYGHTVEASRGEMVSLETQTDRTLFFDLLPLEVGTVAGFKTRVQLYTVPGQVFYNTTRKLVLKGVDGVVFVADSQTPMMHANVESLGNLEENLAELGLSLENTPLVLQYNKQDLPDVLSFDELERSLNRGDWESYGASALTGEGVFETLRGISRLTLISLRKQLEAVPGQRSAGAAAEKAAAMETAGATGETSAPEARAPEESGPTNADLDDATANETAPDDAAPTDAAPEDPVIDETVGKEIEEPEIAAAATSAEPDAPEQDAGVASEREADSAVLQPELETQRHRRDYLLRLPGGDFRRLRRVAVALQLEDDLGNIIREARSVHLDIENPENLSEVLFQLNLALRSKDQETSD